MLSSSSPSTRALVALAVALVVAWAAAAYFAGPPAEGFASRRAREIASVGGELFAADPDASYTDYRAALPDVATAPQFRAVRRLHRAGGLTPEAVERSI